MGSSVVLATAGYDHTIRRALCAAWQRGNVVQCSMPLLQHCGAVPQALAAAGAAAAATAPGPPSASCLDVCAQTWQDLPIRRFWEATSGICYRTLQYADSQVGTLSRQATMPCHASRKPQGLCQRQQTTLGHLVTDAIFCCLQVNKLEITADKTLIAAAGNPHIRWGCRLGIGSAVLLAPFFCAQRCCNS